jgi:hypothetical protein
MDELTGVQALERLHPDLPMTAGHVLRREFEYIRHGTLSWFFNLDVTTGHVLEPTSCASPRIPGAFARTSPTKRIPIPVWSTV